MKNQISIATAVFLMLSVGVAAWSSIPTYTGFTNRNPGYVIQASDWNGEFGNFIAYVNTNIRNLLNTVVSGKGNILSGDGTNGQVLTNAGAGDNGKVLSLDNTTASGLKWANIVNTTLLTTKGDLLGFASNLVRIPVGTDGQVLTADSTAPAGIAWKDGVPSGAILMWSGNYTNVPAGFAVCDGANGTPNLQGLFVVGAQGNGGHAPANGGMGFLAPGGPSGDPAAGTGLGPAHIHSMGGFGANVTVGSSCFVLSPGGNLQTFSATITPRYYALCYIMKL